MAKKINWKIRGGAVKKVHLLNDRGEIDKSPTFPWQGSKLKFTIKTVWFAFRLHYILLNSAITLTTIKT